MQGVHRGKPGRLILMTVRRLFENDGLTQFKPVSSVCTFKSMNTFSYSASGRVYLLSDIYLTLVCQQDVSDVEKFKGTSEPSSHTRHM